MYKKASTGNKNEAISLNDNEDVREAVKTELIANLEEAANKAGQKARDLYESVSRNAVQANEAVTGQIKSRPMQSVLVALGVGFFLGALFRRFR